MHAIRGSKSEKYPHSNIVSLLTGFRNYLIAFLLKLTFFPEGCMADVPPGSRRAWENWRTNPTPVNEISMPVKLAETTSQNSRQHPIKYSRKFVLL